MACLHSWTHCLTLSLSYLVCTYFTVFSLSSNINDYDTSCILCPSRSLTRLGSCRGRTTASKALLQLQRFHAKLNSLASNPKPVLKTSRTLHGTFPCVGHSRVHSPQWCIAAQPQKPLWLAALSTLSLPLNPQPTGRNWL